MYLISVPLNTAAMRRLDIDACVEGDLSETLLDDDAFAALWQTGVFTQVNRLLGVNIDQYEDQAIVGAPHLKVFSRVLRDCMAANPHVDALCLLKAQVERALALETGVYLYF